MHDEENTDGLSRRQALTRLGVGAAAVWSAPVVTGLTMPAAAAGSPPASGCSGCPPLGEPPDGDYPTCGDSGPLGNCFCTPRHDGLGCYCAEDFFCGDEAPPSCSSQADCTNGGVCVDTFCGPVCADPCGTTPDNNSQLRTFGAEMESMEPQLTASGVRR